MAKAIAIRRRRSSNPGRRRARRRGGSTLPLAVIAGFAPVTCRAITGFQQGGLTTATHEVVGVMTGYQMDTGDWNVNNLRHGLVPILLGFLVHKVASKLGVNRALARARVPWVRV